jgi:hypothetical protein
MSIVVDEAVTRQQALFIKMNQTQDCIKVVQGKVDEGVTEISTKLDVVSGKVDDGFGEIDAKMADMLTLTDVRFKGLEENRARIYGEVTHIKDDLVPIANDMVSIFNMVVHNADEAARLAYMVEQLAKKQEQRQFWWNLVMFMMLGIIIMMLGTIIYVVSLPVTVCPFSFPMGPSTPVDVCKNPTNTIIGGLQCLTDKILPRPCRDGYACKRDTFPDW